jgi:hypothetical protein
MAAHTSPGPSYSPALARLLAEPRISPLGPGLPNASAKPELQALNLESAFAPDPVQDTAMAEACLAGIWLYHNFLDESHRIAQNIPSPSGSFWHAIMHRREPDAWNSKYWFRRVGAHPIFGSLREAAGRLPGADPDSPATAPLFRQALWDPFAFVDLCDLARDRNDGLEELCRQIQALEWRLLFDFCYRLAIDRPA